MKHILRFFLIFYVFLAGCQKKDIPHVPAQKTQYLHISFISSTFSLHPREAITYPSAFGTKMLFEGLMRIGRNGEVEPAIAESYELSDDHMTYTFHLRPSKWSNGEEITAYDFEYSWKKVIDPKTGSLGVQNFYPIKNAREILRGRKMIESVGIRALDEKTLEVRLSHPTPYFLEVTATSPFFPVNARVDQENPHWANQVGKDFVCNGPFSLERLRIEDEIVVKKNPKYWDAKNVHLPGIHIAIIKDASTQLNLFEKKQLEWLGDPLSKMPLDAIEAFRKEGKVHFFQTLGLYWFFLNTESFPFNNKKMRQAFAYAINRQLIIDHLLQKEETPAMGVLPHSLASQETPFFQDNDRERALALFQEALDEMGIQKEDLPEITINYNAAPIHMRIATAMQEQWNQVFGLNIKMEQQEWKFHYDKLQKGNYQIGGVQWQSWLRDPIYIMQTFREKSDGVNMSRWENAEYKHLINLAERQADPTLRRTLFNKAETILMEEMPVIPVYFTTIAYAKSDKLKDVYMSELYEIDFRWATLEE
ncbi:MAG: Oligopeptide-binding protein OppA [Chlamydiae bacterium]|nr:Oligopeptide-binding protein OppA [Chlamydiota bacterium]